MREKNNLAEVLLEIRNEAGLHMRAITLFVEQASQFPCKITVEKNKEVVDGKSITDLMTLGAEKGSFLKIVARGDGAHQVIEKLQELINSKFGEK